MSPLPPTETPPPMTRLQLLLATLRSALGAPDYRAYVAHQQQNHPDQPPLSPRDFFRERQAAKYRRGSSRCC